MSDRRPSGRGRDSRDSRDDRRRDDSRSSRRTESSRDHRNSSSMGGSGDFDRSNRGSGTGSGGTQQRHPQLTGQAFSESELLHELPKKKFTGRCRLFVGNLPNEVKDEELKELFKPHGEIAECYLSGKGFAFLRMDTRAHAEAAKEAIDGQIIKGRQVRVRFAVHGAALRVKELSPTVSNEMLYHAFSHFGEVERAVHVVDEKGRPTGEGIVEFERKPSANEAISAVKEKVFLLTACPKPLVVELLEPRDEDDGLAERMIPRTPQLQKEREMGPRFPAPNSFEYIYGMKWKELYDMEKQRRNQVEEELKEARRRLEADMELAYQDYQAQMLREDLQRRQQELERLEAARRDRMQQQQQMGGRPPMGSAFAGGPPPAFGGGGQMGGPPPMGGGGGFGMPPNMSGPPPSQFAPPAQHQHQQPPPQMGGGPPQMAQQAGGRPNVIEGVQRLLQIFKNDDSGRQNGGGPMQGAPQHGGPGGFGAFGGAPPQGGHGGYGGPPVGFGAQQGDYNPPMKRERR